MSVWDNYNHRIFTHGGTKQNATKIREVRFLRSKLPDSLSYHNVKIFTQQFGYDIESEEMKKNAITQNVAIINSDNLNEKYIYSLPGEDIEHGSLIEWMGNHWLVVEKDANTTLYTKAKLLQCNYLLKWVSDNKTIHEQWCVIEDGTKYLTGEYEDRNFVVTRGDSRIAMTIARNKETVNFTRKNRFLIDDPDSPVKLAYLLTKPLKLGLTFNNDGVFKFVLQEVTATGDDNIELSIADYYKYFPKDNVAEDQNDSTDTSESDEIQSDSQETLEPNNSSENQTNINSPTNGKKVWL